MFTADCQKRVAMLTCNVMSPECTTHLCNWVGFSLDYVLTPTEQAAVVVHAAVTVLMKCDTAEASAKSHQQRFNTEASYDL